MTAEIAIMNKMAVALAADSAVTITNPKGQKIYNSINKLFSLSKYHPVGVMIYGNGQLMGVPWESIIKIYRNRLGTKKYSTLKEYAEDFLSFLDGNNPLFPESEQKNYFERFTYWYFSGLRKEIDDEVRLIIDKDAKIGIEQIKKIVKKVIQKYASKLKKLNNLSCYSDNDIESLLTKYGTELDEIRKKVFEELPIEENEVNLLKDVAAGIFVKDGVERPQRSGVVVAGFGENDVYPSIVEHSVDGVINKKLEYKEMKHGHTGLDNTASILPFAQSEMVHTFMEGVDPVMKELENKYLSEIFHSLPENLLKSLEQCTDDEKEVIRDKIKKTCDGILFDYKQIGETYRRQNHVQPILEAVAFLPKDELAAMAESLVNLTSFKRKISLDAETVGGPIDVAIISKGDGFVWIKRKHYFKPELNPYFFANYFKDGNIVNDRSDHDEITKNKRRKKGI